jgi:hypothetical protein
VETLVLYHCIQLVLLLLRQSLVLVLVWLLV